MSAGWVGFGFLCLVLHLALSARVVGHSCIALAFVDYLALPGYGYFELVRGVLLRWLVV